MSVNTHWLWDHKDLEDTPSVRDGGISLEEENKLRREGVKMIKKMGKSINLFVFLKNLKENKSI
ncbi:unnamed protein product [Meloidogyne enterolobii]|uniref:Uncharacterized protein n=1 Tax=Meloidogyne enterolobii TaxID=390850 RepID=A0ACB1AEY3_MELEN